MALEIGSNFSYQGHKFLDNRQGGYVSLSQLKDWDTVVPNGFEVYVEGYGWYQYDSNITSEETGHFVKRADIDLSGTELSETITKHDTDILELMQYVFPVTVEGVTSLNDGTWTFEIGKTITPHFRWTVKRKGTSVTPTSSEVNGIALTENLCEYTSETTITSNTTYSIKSTYQGISGTSSASYRFYYKKYYGVSSNSTLTNSEILSLGNSTWATGWTMGATTFDCTGGKYPYYVFPAEFYNESTFGCWVGGLKNTDLSITDFNLENAQGSTHAYKVVRLNNKQTGSLSIEFKS